LIASNAAEVRVQQRPYDRSGRSLTILDSEIRERIVSKCALLYHPIQETVDKTSAMRNQVEQPRQDSII
jgi:hypothetical protein